MSSSALVPGPGHAGVDPGPRGCGSASCGCRVSNAPSRRGRSPSGGLGAGEPGRLRPPQPTAPAIRVPLLGPAPAPPTGGGQGAGGGARRRRPRLEPRSARERPRRLLSAGRPSAAVPSAVSTDPGGPTSPGGSAGRLSPEESVRASFAASGTRSPSATQARRAARGRGEPGKAEGRRRTSSPWGPTSPVPSPCRGETRVGGWTWLPSSPFALVCVPPGESRRCAGRAGVSSPRLCRPAAQGSPLPGGCAGLAGRPRCARAADRDILTAVPADRRVHTRW